MRISFMKFRIKDTFNQKPFLGDCQRARQAA